LRTQGYLLLPGVIEAELVVALRAELDAARQREEQRFGADALAAIGQLGYVCDVPGMGPAACALLDHDAVHATVRSALGPGARLSVAQGIALDPGMGRGSWPRRWHADLFQMRAAMPEPSYCFAINCLVVLDDMTKANGATSVVPGSQAYVGPGSPDGTELEAIAVDVAAPAGSLLVLDGGLWHAAGHNATGRPRRVMKLLFVRAWIRPQLDYARVISPDAAGSLSPRAAELLGLRPPRGSRNGPGLS
jgi:ectoine hydroxylase-related dioxygenase (phytanoyl-CoA dioxygenase family)